MTDEQSNDLSEEDLDSKADTKAILIMFVTAVFMAMHFVSGFTFDF